MTRKQAIEFLKNNPAKFGRLVGFDKLDKIHNEWIQEMVYGKEDSTLRASRETYKTTCVSINLALTAILLPRMRTLFMRKTDADTKEVIRQTQKIIQDEHTKYITSCIYGTPVYLVQQSQTELTTNLQKDSRGASQLLGLGINGSLTGKHFDRIFTDDIVNIQDRISKAEREKTKLIYQELQNIKNRGGKIFNTGTPWHKDDCFSIMPEAVDYNCYHPEIQKIIPPDVLEAKKQSMTRSLFSANYELRHVAEDDVLFDNAKTGYDQIYVEQAKYTHIDAGYDGEDYTAMTIARKHDGLLYVFGKMWDKHVDECIKEMISWKHRFMSAKFIAEKNADKGYLVKELRKRGERAVSYNENMNKYLKISSYLKGAWKDIRFVEGTDEEYIQQILDYNENAEHDDAPDSLASVVRKLYHRDDV